MNPFLREPPAKREPRAELPTAKADGQVATIRLYEPIDSWGGPWGLSAKEFTATLDALPEDTAEIRLLINSPGGEVWEGLAILNSLRSHSARVVAVVEGIAASAASFIAAGVDEMHVMENSELFVHNAWGLAVGDAPVMQKMANDLAHEDRNIASIYAAKSDGSVGEWLAVMAADTWYSAQEAVDAGLADRVIQAPKGGNNAAEQAKARFNLSALPHAGRAQAPTPTLPGHARAQKPPAEPADHTNPITEGADMASDHLTSGLRERLGIVDAEVDEDGILAALDETLAEHAEPTPASPLPAGTVAIDQATLDRLQTDAAQGRAAREQQVADQREQQVQDALAAGRIPADRADHWRAQLTADPGAAATLASLAPVVSVQAKGYTGGVDEASDDDAIYSKAWGHTEKKGA